MISTLEARGILTQTSLWPYQEVTPALGDPKTGRPLQVRKLKLHRSLTDLHHGMNAGLSILTPSPCRLGLWPLLPVAEPLGAWLALLRAQQNSMVSTA